MEIQGTPIFKRIFNVGNKRVIALRGGSRSSKSYSIMQIVTLWLYTGHIGGKYVDKGMFSVCRTTFPTLRSSVLKDFTNYLHELDIYKYIDHKKTLHEFHFNSRVVRFFPTDDQHKLRGLQHTFFWLNEVNDMPFEVFNQMIMRTERWCYLDANPSGEPWFKTEIEDKRIEAKGDVFLDVSTYKDNPFLPPEMVTEIQGLRDIDYDLWRIYTLGEWVNIKGLIFPTYNLVKEMPEGGEEYYGLDLGFVDPTVFVRVVIIGNNLYIDELIYKSGMLLDETAKLILAHNPRRIFVDSSEPRFIQELRKKGINASATRKGKDSIRQGIGFIKQHHIHVTERSVNTIEEFKRYKWDTDLNNKLQEKPIDKYNHSADAIRYAINRALGGRMRLL